MGMSRILYTRATASAPAVCLTHLRGRQEFRQALAEKAKLEEEVICQHDTIMNMKKKSSSDQAMIEELTLQVGVSCFRSV